MCRVPFVAGESLEGHDGAGYSGPAAHPSGVTGYANPPPSERRTTPVELLWDLVFVFAVTQVAALLAHRTSWARLGEAMLVLALVWWAWSAFVWAANAHDEQSRTLRVCLLAGTVLVFVVGLPAWLVGPPGGRRIQLVEVFTRAGERTISKGEQHTMRVLITGATGTIGLAVADALTARGEQVVALSRDPERGQRVLGGGVEVYPWADPENAPPPAEALAGADAVVNLLGEPVAQRWTETAKQRIRDSRVRATRSLVAALTALPQDGRPRALISQSATGYYGSRGDEPLDEQALPGDDFLAKVTAAWEREAMSAGPSLRVACTRTGVVLSPSGGALAKMLPFFKLGIGGPVAGGRQYVPWIHLDDVIGGLIHCLDHDEAAGPVNLTAPNPVTNAELSHALGHALGRPAVLPVPALALKLLYGEMAEMVTTGQRAIPARLGELGYSFGHPLVEPALKDVLSGP